jgi:predicted DNA-binding mobile mystery protein A
MDFKDYKIMQMLEDANFSDEMELPPIPQKGWIKFFREILSMSSRQLGDRMGISQSRVSELEKGETEKTVKLKTLEKAAEALNCDLYYVLLPRHPVEDFLYDQAYAKTEPDIDLTRRIRNAEGEAFSYEEQEQMREEMIEKLLRNPKKLWQ